MACDVTNAIMEQAPTSRVRELNQKLLERLDTAMEEFGEVPELLAMKADFLNDAHQAIRLLRRAFGQALQRRDDLEVFLIGDSLLHRLAEAKSLENERKAVYETCTVYAQDHGLTLHPEYLELVSAYLATKA
jgi:hypothetical protein